MILNIVEALTIQTPEGFAGPRLRAGSCLRALPFPIARGSPRRPDACEPIAGDGLQRSTTTSAGFAGADVRPVRRWLATASVAVRSLPKRRRCRDDSERCRSAQPGSRDRGRANDFNAVVYCRAASSAAARVAPSALFTAITSTSSSKPRLIPCNSSPAPGSIKARKQSVVSATIVSDCPTPTVSISTTSYPAASQTSMLSRVLRATPPSVPAVGEGRMNAAVLGGQSRHPRFVAEDAAAADAARRIDGQHSDAPPATDKIEPESVDERAFARAGRAGDADADRVARVRKETREQRLRPVADAAGCWIRSALTCGRAQ